MNYRLIIAAVSLFVAACLQHRPLRVRELSTQLDCLPFDSTLIAYGVLLAGREDIRVPFTDRTVRRFVDTIDTSFSVTIVVSDTTRPGRRTLSVHRADGVYALLGIDVVESRPITPKREN